MITINENDVEVRGSMLDVLIDLSRAINAVHNAAEDMYDKEFADEAVVLAGKIAAFQRSDPSDEDIEKMMSIYIEEFGRVADEYIKRRQKNDKR